MKRTLRLHRETLRTLQPAQLEGAQGGGFTDGCTTVFSVSCQFTCAPSCQFSCPC